MVKVQKNVRTPFPTFYSRPLYLPHHNEMVRFLYGRQTGNRPNQVAYNSLKSCHFKKGTVPCQVDTWQIARNNLNEFNDVN